MNLEFLNLAEIFSGKKIEKIKAKSNLEFTKKLELSLSFSKKGKKVCINFLSDGKIGFSRKAKIKDVLVDGDEKVFIYSYKSADDKYENVLQLKVVTNDAKVYGQTVQNIMQPGGSTFNFNL